MKKAMIIEHQKILGIDETLNTILTNSKRKERKGQDMEINFYDVLDSAGTLVARCEVQESMSIYPPFPKHTWLKKYSPDGELLQEKIIR